MCPFHDIICIIWSNIFLFKTTAKCWLHITVRDNKANQPRFQGYSSTVTFWFPPSNFASSFSTFALLILSALSSQLRGESGPLPRPLVILPPRLSPLRLRRSLWLSHRLRLIRRLQQRSLPRLRLIGVPRVSAVGDQIAVHDVRAKADSESDRTALLQRHRARSDVIEAESVAIDAERHSRSDHRTELTRHDSTLRIRIRIRLAFESEVVDTAARNRIEIIRE